jgi:hypothetical protein
MLLDGVLVPARALLNGATITQDRAHERIDYFHIELDAHGVIFAEGAASETFVDDGSRALFQNAAEFHHLYPDAPPAGGFCAPRIEAGERLDAIRRRLAGLAADVRSTMQDVTIDRTGLHEVTVWPGTDTVRLISAAGHAPGDARRLGIAVAQFALDGAALGLQENAFGPGFHAAEAGWRWTDGAACLVLGAAPRPRRLSFDVVCLAPAATQAA